MGELYNPQAFALTNYRPKHLIPDIEIGTIADISIAELKERGIKGVVLDVDNTLGPYGCKEVHPILKLGLKEMRWHFRTMLLSNTTPERLKTLEGYFGIPALASDHKKPDPWVNKEIEALWELQPEQLAAFGDRLSTDIAGANRAGWTSIKVDPFDVKSEPKAVRVARVLENFLLAFYRE